MNAGNNEISPQEQNGKRCAIYTRKSTSAGLEQDFNSLDAQREACEHYIQAQAHQGWHIIPDHYDDGGFTGANLERPAFCKLLDDIDAGKIDVVLVYKVDRLSRSLLDFAQVMDRFHRAGVAFVSVTQNFSTADAMGRLTLNLLMSFAEFEREMIAERTRDKIAAARRRGKWTGGKVPLGYSSQDKRLVIEEMEAIVVREIFDLYIEHRSSLAVTKELNKNHRATKRYRTKTGKMNESHPWTKANVLRVLRNPIYAGYIPCGDELHEGEHLAIIDRDTFSLAQAILDAASSGGKNNGRNPAYILRGVLRCGCCGQAFVPASTRNKGNEYRYYRCLTRDKSGRDACPSAPLPAEAIEAYVIERIRQVTTDGKLAAEVTARVKTRAEVQRKELACERRGLPGSIASLSAEVNRLIDTLPDTTGTARGLLDKRIRDLAEQLGRCEARLAQVEKELVALDELEIEAGWVAKCLSDFDSVWEMLSLENRGRLVRAVVHHVEVNEPEHQVIAVLADIGAPCGDNQAAQP